MDKLKHPDLHSPENETEFPDQLNASKSAYNELLNTCTYGIEYVIDEIFKESLNKSEQNSIIDWSGISDLTMD